MNKRDLTRMRKLNQQLIEKWGGRIVLSGELRWQHQIARWFCHDCKQHFHQTAFSLAVRGSSPRCKCPPMDPSRRFSQGDNPKSRGHRCLPEWEQWDLPLPPTIDLGDGREGPSDAA